MILDGEDGPPFEPDAAIAAVEQRDVRFFDRIWQALAFHCKTVVHGSNFYLSGRIIHDRVICSMMTVRHFYGSAAQCQPKQLMAEADPEQGYAGFNDLADDGESVFARSSWVAGAI